MKAISQTVQKASTPNLVRMGQQALQRRDALNALIRGGKGAASGAKGMRLRHISPRVQAGGANTLNGSKVVGGVPVGGGARVGGAPVQGPVNAGGANTLNPAVQGGQQVGGVQAGGAGSNARASLERARQARSGQQAGATPPNQPPPNQPPSNALQTAGGAQESANAAADTAKKFSLNPVKWYTNFVAKHPIIGTGTTMLGTGFFVNKANNAYRQNPEYNTVRTMTPSESMAWNRLNSGNYLPGLGLDPYYFNGSI
jgi:hypothetical protein